MPPTESVNERLARIDQTTTYIAEHIERLDHTIFGNGSPGLRVDVDRLKQRAEGLSWWKQTVVAAIVAGVVSLVVGGITIKHADHQDKPASVSRP